MTNLSELIKTIAPTFREARIGGQNSYWNPSYQSAFKLAWITVHKGLSQTEGGLVVGDSVYTAKTSVDGAPYINCLNKAVTELVYDEATQSLMDEYNNAAKNAVENGKKRQAEYKAAHSEPSSF